MNCLTGITPVTGGDGNIISFHGSYTFGIGLEASE
jgi:hypothetical protein